MNKKLVLILILCLVGALSITAVSARVESTIISPPVTAQPVKTGVPDSPGASDEDHGRGCVLSGKPGGKRIYRQQRRNDTHESNRRSAGLRHR